MTLIALIHLLSVICYQSGQDLWYILDTVINIKVKFSPIWIMWNELENYEKLISWGRMQITHSALTSRTFIFSFEKLTKTYFHRSLIGYKWVWAEWWPMHIYRVRRIELFLCGNCCVGLWLQLKFIPWNMIQLINVTIKATFFLLVPLKIMVLVSIVSLWAASPLSRS